MNAIKNSSHYLMGSFKHRERLASSMFIRVLDSLRIDSSTFRVSLNYPR